MELLMEINGLWKDIKRNYSISRVSKLSIAKLLRAQERRDAMPPYFQLLRRHITVK
jgi:hypothetical protein